LIRFNNTIKIFFIFLIFFFIYFLKNNIDPLQSADEYISVCKRLSIIDLVITSWKKEEESCPCDKLLKYI